MSGACCTPCDPDCEQRCHEIHVASYRRAHQPEDCPAWPAYRDTDRAPGEVPWFRHPDGPEANGGDT